MIYIFGLILKPYNSSLLVTGCVVSCAARAGVVSGLAPGGTYEFALRGETRGGRGAAARWTQHMSIGAPPRPAPSALPAPGAASPSTVAVRFRSDYFSPANGNVTSYTLVVTEDPSAPAGGVGAAPARMPSWRDVQRLPVWPPYQVRLEHNIYSISHSSCI